MDCPSVPNRTGTLLTPVAKCAAPLASGAASSSTGNVSVIEGKRYTSSDQLFLDAGQTPVESHRVEAVFHPDFQRLLEENRDDSPPSSESASEAGDDDYVHLSFKDLQSSIFSNFNEFSEYLLNVNSQNWDTLSEDLRRYNINVLYRLQTLLQSNETDTLINAFKASLPKLDTVEGRVKLKQLLENTQTVYNNLKTLLSPEESPLLQQLQCVKLHLQKIKQQQDTHFALMKLDSLEGSHTVEQEALSRLNKRYNCGMPKCDSDGLMHTFRADSTRTMMFNIIDTQGNSVFDTAPFQTAREAQKASGSSSTEANQRFSDHCRQGLLAFCTGDRKDYLPAMSELVTQTPINFLKHAFDAVCVQHCWPELVNEPVTIIPKDRHYHCTFQLQETEAGKESENIRAELTLSWPFYEVMLPDSDNPILAQQNVTIQAAVELVSEKPCDRDFEFINITVDKLQGLPESDA